MKTTFRRLTAVSLGVAAALVLTAGITSASAVPRGGPGGGPHDGSTTLTQAQCTSLAGLAIPAKAFDLPTNGADVETAVWDAAGGYCAVTGWIRAVSAPQDMQFRVNLPATWNGRTLQFGGGGFDGSLVTATGPYTAQPNGTPTALAQGWVTLGSDGGHQGGPGFDGTFQLDEELFLNYGQWSVKKAHDAAAVVIEAAYGADPEWSYFIGGSQGGHEALDAAARYPKDYDGVIANYPAYNVTMMHVGAVNFRDALQLEGGAGHLNAAETTTITTAVYAACDPLDGATDGIVSNVAGCGQAFDIETLACPPGVDPATVDTCLSDVEIEAAVKITTDYDLGIEIEGNSIFAKSALFEGALYQGFAGFGSSAEAQGLQFQVFAATMRYGVAGDPPGFDPYTVDPLDYADRVQEVGEIMDVTDVSLNRFRAHGGKVILTHGTIDDFITPHNTVQYWESLQDEFGKRLDSFAKFYMVPGWGHGQGRFVAQYDGLDAIVDWVENGVAPSGLVASDGNAGADRTRPMCEYPAWPEYTGSGSVDEASSFACVTG
jgi:feruloyl esterase